MRAVCNLRSAGLLSEPTRLWPLAGIIIETTGMADPGPVAQTFFMDESIKEFARLDGIVTLVDAKHIEQHLDEEKPEGAENESVEQIAFADRLLLNKIDLVSEADLGRIEKRLRDVNKYAPVLRCQNAGVAMDQVIGLKAFELQRVLEMDPEFLSDSEHMHDQSVSSVDLVGRNRRRLAAPHVAPSSEATGALLRALETPFPASKSSSSGGGAASTHTHTWVASACATGVLLSCDSHSHQVGFEREGELHMERTNAWIAKLLQEKGTDGWSKWPSWRGHSGPPRAHQFASEGVGLPSALGRRGPASQTPPRGRGLPA